MLSPINGDCALTVALSELHLKLRQNYAEMRKHPSRAWGEGGGRGLFSFTEQKFVRLVQ